VTAYTFSSAQSGVAAAYSFSCTQSGMAVAYTCSRAQSGKTTHNCSHPHTLVLASFEPHA